MNRDLPEIPVVTDTDTPLALFEKKRGVAEALAGVCRKIIPGFILNWLSARSETWLNRANPPYKEELDRIAEVMG